MAKDRIHIGGASGFWGDSLAGPLQLVEADGVDYLVFDYLAELTMSLLAGARQKDPAAGFATDFVGVAMRAILPRALERGIRIVANAGGMNPRGCADALRALAAELGVDVRIGVVEGDDVLGALEGVDVKLLSANAYLGALPIKAALDAGARVVITGRCVDSALVLGPLLHEFDWPLEDFDRLAMGSLAGHLIECGCQGAGGLFTDWDRVPDWPHAGYPIVECARDGSFVVTKPAGTGGLVCCASVAEQLVYEIGDPAAYVLPDVVCDFTQVTLRADGEERVAVAGARGSAPPPTYKVSATFVDGFRCNAQLTIVGFDAARKARRTGQAILMRTRELFAREGLGDYADTHVEVLGEGGFESVLWLAVCHRDKRALEIFAREIAPAATSWAPGTTGMSGRPAVVPRVRQRALAIEKERVQVRVDGVAFVGAPVRARVLAKDFPQAIAPSRALLQEPTRVVPLIDLAYARSGDKGDSSNIGVIARKPEWLPLLREQLTADAVKAHLAHLVDGEVTRYELPGIHALNFVCERALGGGGLSSLRHDPLGKGMAQILLAMPVRAPA
jgi:hypothetical protein